MVTTTAQEARETGADYLLHLHLTWSMIHVEIPVEDSTISLPLIDYLGTQLNHAASLL